MTTAHICESASSTLDALPAQRLRSETVTPISQYGGVRVAETVDHVIISANWMTKSGEDVRLAIRDARDFYGISVGFNGRSHMLPIGNKERFRDALAGDDRPSVQWLHERLGGIPQSIPATCDITPPIIPTHAQLSELATMPAPFAKELPSNSRGNGQQTFLSPFEIQPPVLSLVEPKREPSSLTHSELPHLSPNVPNITSAQNVSESLIPA